LEKQKQYERLGVMINDVPYVQYKAILVSSICKYTKNRHIKIFEGSKK